MVSVVGRIIETPDCVAEGAAWLAAHDARFAQALALTGPLPLRRRAGGFADLLGAIVSQQVSVASANAIWARLEAAGLDTGPAVAAAGMTPCAPAACRARRSAMPRRWPRPGSTLTACRCCRMIRWWPCWWPCRVSGAGRPRFMPCSAWAGPMCLRPPIWPCRNRRGCCSGWTRALGTRLARHGGGVVAVAGGCGAASVVLLPGGQGP
jgi:hypothetical protein